MPGTLAEAIQMMELDPPALREVEVMVKVLVSST
jgi:hypothetical protein